MHSVQMRKGRINPAIEKNKKERQQLADNIGKHMQFIIPFVLYEYMGFGWKKLDNCMNKIYEVRLAWQQDPTNAMTKKMLNYCEVKKIDAYGFVKRLPQSDKMYLSDIKKGCFNAMNSIDSALLHCMLMTVPVLKESYRMSNKTIETFFDKIAYIIHMYTEKMPCESCHVFSDRYIRDIFLEEQSFDMYKGEYVK